MPKTAPAAKTSAQPNTLTGLAGWVEVFRAGDHTDSKGRALSFSRGDLAQMAANQALGAAPAVLGHPQHHDPAYAWTKAFKVEGDSLFASFEKINPAFEAGVASGAYRNRSVHVVQDKSHGWRVRHVGWLGAVPPAIDGLAPVEFSADESDASYEFSAPGYSLIWGLESIAKLLRSLREQFIARDGLEAADAALPQWQIDNAMEAATSARREFEAQTTSSFSHPAGDHMSNFTQEQLDAARAEAAAEGRAAVQAEFSAASTELAQLRAERRNERLSAQIAGWVAGGKLLPAEQAGMAEFMATLDEAESAQFSFSAADSSTVKKTPVAWFAEFMAARAPVVKLGQRIDLDPKSDPLDKQDHVAIANAASEFQAAEAAAGRTISIEAAVSHVVRRS